MTADDERDRTCDIEHTAPVTSHVDLPLPSILVGSEKQERSVNTLATSPQQNAARLARTPEGSRMQHLSTRDANIAAHLALLPLPLSPLHF
jgi:hypothetical protein